MNKLKISLSVCSIFVLLTGVSYAKLSTTEDSFSMPKNVAPEISQKMGTVDLELPKSKWPKISECKGSNGCCDKLRTISDTYLPGEQDNNFKEYKDLEIDVKLKPEFRTSSKLLVYWTIRVVASTFNPTLPYTWSATVPDGGSCADVSTFGLTARQSVPKGEVKTQLFVVDTSGLATAKGSIVSMVFPGSDGNVSVQTIVPPTPPTPPTPSGCCKAGDPGCCVPKIHGGNVAVNCQCPCGFVLKKGYLGYDRCFCEDAGKLVDLDGKCVDPVDCKFGSGGNSIAEGTCDPTITGSYVLKKDDFGGMFPEKMKLQVRIHNDTAWNLVSLANQHNIVITQFPVTKDN